MKFTPLLCGAVMISLLALCSQSFAADVYTNAADSKSTIVEVKATGSLDNANETVGEIPLDSEAHSLDAGALGSGQLRLGLQPRLIYMMNDLPLVLQANLEGDFIFYDSNHTKNTGGEGFPGEREAKASGDVEIRNANALLAIGPYLQVGAGYTSSTWGMGLLANNGDTKWNPRQALFRNPRQGDVSRRIFASTGPWSPAGISLFGFVGEAERDDQLLEGDEADDIGLGARFDFERTRGGVYYVQRSITSLDGDKTEIQGVDLHLKTAHDLPFAEGLRWNLETEVAYITGDTELAPSFDFEKHDIEQLGWALRTGIHGKSAGFVFDLLYATGDQNFDDKSQNAFRADPNYEMGLFLFRHVLASQTARAPFTASNPDLVGEPAEDLDRLPSRGSAFNTITTFPRLYWQPIPGLTVYGGPLFAFSEVDLSDPFNTRLAGGDPRNALDGNPGSYLGTELDLGVRYYLQGEELGTFPFTLGLGLEGGTFLPGEALNDADGNAMGSVSGGRVIVQASF